MRTVRFLSGRPPMYTKLVLGVPALLRRRPMLTACSPKPPTGVPDGRGPGLAPALPSTAHASRRCRGTCLHSSASAASPARSSTGSGRSAPSPSALYSVGERRRRGVRSARTWIFSASANTTTERSCSLGKVRVSVRMLGQPELPRLSGQKCVPQKTEEATPGSSRKLSTERRGVTRRVPPLPPRSP